MGKEEKIWTFQKWVLDMQIQYNKLIDQCVNNLTLDVVLSGYVQTGPEWKGKNVCSSFSRLYLIESGSGWVRFEDQIIPLEPGKAYLIPPGLRISYGCDGQLSKLYFHLNLWKPDRYDFMQNLDQICVLELPDGWLQQMRKQQSSRTPLDALLLKQYLLQLLAGFAQQARLSTENISNYSQHVTQSILYVQRHLSAKLSVNQLAQQCFLSERQLNNLFRKELGVTPGQYLDDQLMAAAQRLLILTTDSIGAISDALGFSDQFYFSRKFKKAFGQTPLQYRRGNHI